MRTLVHLSDLHFGRIDEKLLSPLVEAVRAARPDAVVVSGDLTQRARVVQFVEARDFLRRLPTPQIVVPGNHDVPLYNVLQRFVRPLGRFRRYIDATRAPIHVDEEIAVLGVNTARALVFKNGRINERQVAMLQQVLCTVRADAVKVVVTHHPFDTPAADDEGDIVGGAGAAMQALARCGVDVLLAGHMHVSRAIRSSVRHAVAGHEALIVLAGTATSTRARGEVNSFNVLRLEKRRVEVQRHEWASGTARFECAGVDRFQRNGAWWESLPASR